MNFIEIAILIIVTVMFTEVLVQGGITAGWAFLISTGTAVVSVVFGYAVTQ